MSSSRTFTRRALLRAAVAGAGAGVLGGCTSSSAHVGATTSGTVTPAASTPAATPATTATGRPNWTGLQAWMTGRVYVPGSSGYDAARLTANPRYDGLRPAAVARCATPADVATAVSFARDASVPFTVRSGGHSYTGASTGAGLVVDVSAMNQVRVDPVTGRVKIGAGARLVDVYTAVAGAGRAVAAGSCPSVGVTGLTLGGGVGVLTRDWGLTCDQMISYDLVTADGTVRTVDAGSDPDLFWAGQGGAGGSFGAVTALTLQTRPAPDLTLFAMGWPWQAAAEVVQAWQRWGPTTDPRCWSTCKVQAGPGRAPTVLVAGVWNGPDASLGPVLSALLGSVGAGTIWRSSSRHHYLDAMLVEAGCQGADCHLPPAGTLVREPLAATSHMPTAVMSPMAASTMVSAVEQAAQTAGLHVVTASLDALGGTVASLPAASTAFVHRLSPFSVQYTATWMRAEVPGSRFDSVVRGMREAMTPYLGTGAYVNYCDSALDGWQDAYWGANYARLQSVKRAVDPHELFNGPQSVRP
jgi:FAD binding domain/Berberine and berberine like